MIHRTQGTLRYRNEPASPAAHQLEAEGYCMVRGVFTADEVDALKSDIDRVYDEYPVDRRGPDEKAWSMFRYQMLNRSAPCQDACAHPRVLEVLEPLLGEDCHVISNTAWRNPPMAEKSHLPVPWHIDAGPHVPLPEGTIWPENIPHPVFAVGVHIYLQDCDLADGPTAVVPRSHLSGRVPPRMDPSSTALSFAGKSPVALVAAAGDVGFFVSDIWHRRLPTLDGDSGRYFLQVHYGRRDIAQRLLISEDCHQLSDAAFDRAQSERGKTVVGLHPRRFYDG
ncbi:MAG: phytanoyl-CoA dioxygenase family protein [Pseudomonadota bacterium]